MKKFDLLPNDFGGKLIVFEGIDGSGKTTLINLLKEKITKAGYNVTYLKMPSDRMRNLKVFDEYDNSKDATTRNTRNLTNLTIMVSGDRLIQQDETIIPALKQNHIVICDRYCFTGYIRCSDQIIATICKRFIKPDLVFVCDCKVETAQKRIMARENEKNNFYDVFDATIQRKKFLSLARKNNYCIINTDDKLEYCLNLVIDQIKNILKK